MIKTIVFEKNGKTRVETAPESLNRNKLYWINAEKQDNIHSFIEKEFGVTQELSRDLIEEQRPRIEDYNRFTLVVLSYPLDFNSAPVQISIILTKNGIMSISERHLDILDKLMENFQHSKHKVKNTSAILSKIIESLNEYSIKLASEFENYLMKYESAIVRKPLKKNYTIILNDYKQRVFTAIKDLKANLDTVNCVVSGEYRINSKYIESNLEDRILFLKEELEYSKEIIDNMISQSMSAYNYALNKTLTNLTVVGAILIIPTIITGLFGMNVSLPGVTFWQIIALMLLFSLAIYKLVKMLVYK